MNKKKIQNERVKKRFYGKVPKTDIEKFVAAYAPHITQMYGLGKITIAYSTVNDKENSDAMFQIKYDPIYKTAFITAHPFSVEMYANGEYDTLFHGIVHEFAHVVTDELAEVAESRSASEKEIRDKIEKTTESVAQLGRELLKHSKGIPDYQTVIKSIKQK